MGVVRRGEYVRAFAPCGALLTLFTGLREGDPFYKHKYKP